MTDATPDEAVPGRRAVIGLVVALVLLALSFAVPPLTGWDVDARSDMLGLPPLHGFVDLRASPTSVLAVLLAAAGVWRGEALARTLSWRRLLLVSYVVGLAWLVALALVDGEVGLTRVMVSPTEYMVSAREITDVPAMLREYVDRIPYSAPDNWPIHLAGHPPGAVLLHVALVRLGLGGDLVAALVLVAIAASIPLATMTTLRLLDAERWARLAAPFLVLSPAAVFLAVSGDALFAALAAWGLAALAASARAVARGGLLGWGVAAGLLLGWCVMSSYGLPLLGILALAVLWLARSWWPLPVAAVTALARRAGLRRARLRVVGGLPGAPRPVLGRDRQEPTDVVLGLGQPRCPPRLGRTAPRCGPRGRRAAPHRWGADRRGAGRGGRARRRRRRPEPDVEGRGGADLAAVRAVADPVPGAAARGLAALGARAAGAHGAAGRAPALHQLVALRS